MSLWDKLQKVPSVYLYASLAILVALAVLAPSPAVGLVHDNVQVCYDFIEGMEDNSVIVLEVGNDVAYFTSHWPGVKALLTHAIKRHNAKIIAFGNFEDVALVWAKTIEPALSPILGEYGEDYVLIGYVPGGEVGTAVMARDLKTMKTDHYGKLLDDLPLMQQVNDATDVALWVHAGYRYLFPIRQVWPEYKTPIIVIEHPGAIGYLPVYVEAEQIVGFIHGWPGGAEYEFLIGEPGMATAGRVAMSIGYFTCIGAAIVGNIAFVGAKLSKRGKK